MPERKGRGVVRDAPKMKLTFGSDTVCRYCKGKGKLNGKVCGQCRGEGFIREVPRVVDPPS